MRRRGVAVSVSVLALSCFVVLVGAATPPSLLAPIDASMQAAEASLRGGDAAAARRQYAAALSSAWTLAGRLELAAAHPSKARDAFRRASSPLDPLASAEEKHPPGPAAAAISDLTSGQRRALAATLKTLIARAYFNLGVLAAQEQDFARAAGLLETGASQAPDFPHLQASLGIAHFNAQQYTQATRPLARALAVDPSDAGLRRMLALAWLNLEAYDKAAALLREDPSRDSDPSLQYAYGMALVRSGHADEAERIFTQLVAAHGNSAELNVILGEAQAEQGDFEAATRLLTQALTLDPHVADANAALATIYFKQGRLDRSEAALRLELSGHPGNMRATQMLATVLDLEGKHDEAVPLLRAIVATRPDSHEARYLLGKILLAQGHAAAAVEQLAEAVRLAPDDASAHYQLAQAYRQLGDNERADAELTRYRSLKDTQRGRRQ